MKTATGAAGSNYFKVKHENAFRVWLATLPADTSSKVINGEKHFTIYPQSEFQPHWHLQTANPSDERSPIEQIASPLSRHIAEGSNAQLFEISFLHPQVYICAALAVNSAGVITWKWIDDISRETVTANDSLMEATS